MDNECIYVNEYPLRLVSDKNFEFGLTSMNKWDKIEFLLWIKFSESQCLFVIMMIWVVKLI